MKTYYRLLFLALTLALGLSACSGSGKGSGEKISLELKLEKGQVYKRVSRLDQEIKTKMMGMTSNMHQSMEFYVKQEVQDVNADGLATVRVVYDRIVFNMEVPMAGKMEYDSETDDENSDSPFAAVMEPLIGNGFSMTIDKHGKVQEVVGMDEILENIGKNTPGGGDVGQTFNEDNLKKTMQNMVAMYPDVLVGVGDTWGAEMEAGSDQMPMKMDMTYEVKEVTGKQVFLNVDGKITADASEMPGGMGSMEMEGTQGGTLTIDRGTGMVDEADFTQDITGEMKAMGMTTPMEIRSKIVVEAY